MPLPRIVPIVTCATIAVSLGVMSHATGGATIRVWKVGSPHDGDTPPANVPFAFRQELTRRGVSIAVEAFPAKGFAGAFLDAVTRNAAPDVLVFDNMGVIDGITVNREKFDGIGQESTIRRDLIRVTGAFDDLLGPRRGWIYLFSSSPNHSAARTFALTTSNCPTGFAAPEVQRDLREIVPKLATAYLEGDATGVETHSDPERLAAAGLVQEPVSVGTVRPCGAWGNPKLALVWVNASYDARTTIGHQPVLMVFRKPSYQWQFIVAARDPVSNGAFIKEVPSLLPLLQKDGQTHALPAPATLLVPATGHFPTPSAGQRFGTFSWRSSPSEDVVAEIVEFAYQNDARLFLKRPAQPGSRGGISAGSLWHTRGLWNWRVWSITGAGDIVFSDARSFVH